MKRLILIVLSFFFLTTPAVARDNKTDMWIVSQRSGDARVVHRGLQPASLRANAALAPGDVVITGASGRATLARGSDYIVIAPRSELRLPASAQASGFTRVVQQLGTMLFKIKHTGVPHFAVDTPMLAAVVKGTTFTVIVERERSAVQVIEGAVEVTASEGGMQRLVEGGNTVFIDRRNPTQLITANADTLGASESSSETSVKITGSEGESLSAVTSLTGGLVQPEPVVLAANTSTANLSAPIAPVAPIDDNGTPVQPGLGTIVDLPADTVAPIAEPIVDALPVIDLLPIAEPIVEPIVGSPVVGPIIEPIVDPIVDIVIGPIVEPIVDVVIEPVVETIVEPIVEPIVETIVAPIVEPIIETIVAPIVETIVEPVVEPVIEPVVAPIVETIVEPVVQPIVEPIVKVLPILEPITKIVLPPLGL